MGKRTQTASKKRWTANEIKKLQVAVKLGMCNNDVTALFPNRNKAAVIKAIKRFCNAESDIGRYPKVKRKRYNPNPPTMLTYILVHNYYEENIRHGMTRAEAIADVGDTLNRSEAFVKKALKVDVRKYVEKEDEEDETY